MKRGAGEERVKAQLNFMRKAPDSFVRTSIIVGHPGETDEEFDALCDFMKEFDFDRTTIFSYSDEEGTKAVTMDELKIDKETIAKRIEILNAIVEEKTQKSLDKDIGKEVDIIAIGESSEHEFFIGARKTSWAEDIDGEILINENESGEEVVFGKRYIAKISTRAGENLIGTIIRPA